jgi:Ala-tRNA(Pro) deacylase
MNESTIFDFLTTNNITYKPFKHQPVFTVEDKPILIDSPDTDKIPGLQTKSLFLKDKKNGSLFLVSVTEDKRVDLKELGNLFGGLRFTFGTPEELFEYLHVQPGSVTPFGLICDTQQRVTFVLDKDLASTDFVNFHPLRNDMTVCLSPQQFLVCMEKIAHKPQIITIPTRV